MSLISITANETHSIITLLRSEALWLESRLGCIAVCSTRCSFLGGRYKGSSLGI